MNDKSAVAAIVQALAEEEGPLTPKKKLLVQAAIHCFAENGYSAASTRMIADRASVAEATIFRHFGSKKELLMRLIGPLIKRLLAPAASEEMRETLERSDQDFGGFIRAIMLNRLAFADQYAPFIRILIQEVPLDPALRALVKGNAAGLFKSVFLPALSHFQHSGQAKNMPPERALRMVISLLGGYYLNRTIFAPGEWDDVAEVDAMVDLVLRGIAI
jgi:AcrR family transcriptional regulator